MDSMVERVARAIAWQDLTPLGKQTARWPGDFSTGEADRYRLKAHAAIESMRTPTDVMSRAGVGKVIAMVPDEIKASVTEVGATSVYRAMITAALARDDGQVAETAGALAPSVPE